MTPSVPFAERRIITMTKYDIVDLDKDVQSELQRAIEEGILIKYLSIVL